MVRLLTCFCALFLALLSYRAEAQQLQHFSQYRFAGFTFNPAFAGSDDFWNALAIHRTQWTGINDAPRTYMMGLHAPSASGKMGFGGTLYTDAVGPTRRVGVQGAYAYHLKTSETTKLALGLSFGFTQFSIDGSQISLREQGDRAAITGLAQELKPDASFGALWYSKKWFVGLSANQILNNRLDFFPGDSNGRMAVHYFLTGAYKFRAGDDFEVEPGILVKYVDPMPTQLDLTARFIYKGNLWLGAAYRSGDAASLFAGYKIMDYLTLGYAFDLSTSAIKQYADGTHEILILVRFEKNLKPAPEN
jgi:type IX secretion system PorP/SprF family membrane protein